MVEAFRQYEEVKELIKSLLKATDPEIIEKIATELSEYFAYSVKTCEFCSAFQEELEVLLWELLVVFPSAIRELKEDGLL